MAMNKSERATLDALCQALAQARSMRWPEYAPPQPMTAAEIELEFTAGRTREYDSDYGGKVKAIPAWEFNEYRGEVFPIALGRTSRAEIYQGKTSSWSRSGGPAYRYQHEALRALRLAITDKVSKQLASIDARIAEAEANG